MSHNPIRPWRNIERRKSRRIMVGDVPVGGDAPISVQTMNMPASISPGIAPAMNRRPIEVSVAMP